MPGPLPQVILEIIVFGMFKVNFPGVVGKRPLNFNISKLFQDNLLVESG
jgi:hypothetical protein